MYIQPAVRTATIASSAADSSEIEIGGNYTMFTVVLPATFDGTHLQVKVAPTRGGTYQPLYDATGAPVNIVVAQGTTVGITGTFADAIAGCNYIELSSDAADGESGARTLQLLMK
jgi:hypothetical protein